MTAWAWMATFLLAGQMCSSNVKDEVQLDLMNDMTCIDNLFAVVRAFLRR